MVSVNPLTKYFCMVRRMITVGIEAIIAPVMRMGGGTPPLWPWSFDREVMTGLYRSESTNPKIRSFHVQMN
jgi:hypothetical protein